MRLNLCLCLGLSTLVLVACEPAQPVAGVGVGSNGPTAAAGVKSGRVGAGVSTNGAYVAADVIQTENVNVAVSNRGVGVSTGIGNGPIRVGWGFGGWHVGI